MCRPHSPFVLLRCSKQFKMYHLAKGLYLYATSKEGISSSLIPMLIPRSVRNSFQLFPTNALLTSSLNKQLLTPNRVLRPPSRPRQRRQNHLPRTSEITLPPLTPQPQAQNCSHSRPKCLYNHHARHVPQDVGRWRTAQSP